jgi:hypothetical protein
MFFKQFGVGLAAAILIDATIVRAVLLPATMELLGDWNWYLPRWLDWLPRLEHEEQPTEAPQVHTSLWGAACCSRSSQNETTGPEARRGYAGARC